MPMYFDCAYPVGSATVGSQDIGVQGMERGDAGPRQVAMEEVRRRVVGCGVAWRRRRRDITSAFVSFLPFPL